MLQENASEDADSARVSPSVQYFEESILGGKLCERIIMGSTTYGLRSASDVQAAFNEEILNQSANLLQGIDVCVWVVWACDRTERRAQVLCVV